MGKEITNEFQLFFSGVESDSYFNIVAKESSTMLMSYLYLQKKGKKFLEKRVKDCPNLKLLIDSGAHTFIADEKGMYAKWEMKDWEKYIEEYISWIKDNKDHIFAVAELDIDNLVGIEVVDEWREKYFKPLESEGIQVIYVWHSIRKLTGWDMMCKKFNYVGFSYNADSDITPQFITKLFSTARKYGSKIHGFGITGFDAMCANPYYTVDSSTWLVGTQFGELNYFDGRSMKRLKKLQWKRQFKNKLIKLGANETLMMKEEPYELIRINVLTFVEVEKHVRKRVKTKSYWLTKEKVVEEDIEEYERGSLPDAEWWEGGQEDWKSYAKALGIDTRLEKEAGVTFIKLFDIFINFDTDCIDQMTTEELFSYCDIFGLEGINTSKKALEALPACFKDHAIGKTNELGNISESQDSDVPAKAKEREDYIEDEDCVTLEVTKKECDSILAGFLPSKDDEMPEVEAYDAELRNQGIIVTRDEKGKFLKGQKLVRKPKKLYSDKMYKLSCSTCYKGTDCPDYRAGYVCAYNKMFKKFNTRNKEDLMDAMHSIVESNVERLQRMMMFEMMDGGMVDANVTQLMDMNMRYLNMMHQMDQTRLIAQRTVRVGESGDIETVETVTSNGQTGSFLERLFGGTSKAEDKDPDGKKEDIIDITPEKK